MEQAYPKNRDCISVIFDFRVAGARSRFDSLRTVRGLRATVEHLGRDHAVLNLWPGGGR